MLNLRFILASIMLAFLSLQVWTFTINDYYTLALVLVSASIMFHVVLDMQIGNKKALRVNTKEDGRLYRFLSKEKTIPLYVLSFIASLVLAYVLTVILAGIVYSHGKIAFLLIITVISMTVFSFLNQGSQTINKELALDLANHANNFLYIVLLAVILNLVLSAILSAHDVMMFLTHEITLDNFDEISSSEAIVKNGSNTFTRALMNLYILMENLKLALTSEFMILAGIDLSTKQKYFYIAYLAIFILNIIKLLSFSFSFVLLQKGLENFAKKLISFISDIIKLKKDQQEKIDYLKEIITGGMQKIVLFVSKNIKKEK